MGQGRTGEAACQLTVLQSVANQVLDDMEDKEIVPNRSASNAVTISSVINSRGVGVEHVALLVPEVVHA